MWIRALISIKMDRPITPEHYIVPGGYSIKKGRKIADFDFDSYAGTISKDDPSILHCELKDFVGDGITAEEFVKDVLSGANGIDDCFVYTGEPGEDPEINFEKLLSFILISGYDDDFAAKPSDMLDVRIYPDEMEFRFTDAAIAAYNKKLAENRAGGKGDA